MISNRKGLLALSPLVVFVSIYALTALLANDFYKVPTTISFLLAAVYAIAISAYVGGGMPQCIRTFSRGAGAEQVMLMVWIFVLAGAFSGAANDMGCVEATVGVALRMLPEGMLLGGLFLASCVISLSIGTSVGTIVALCPIAAGVAAATHTDMALVAGLVVGGSFFGDNLSFISDTTVAATSTQDCRMSDKFRANIFIVLPAALAIFVLYLLLGNGITAPQNLPSPNWLKVIPYMVVLVAALCGMNVMAVLTLGLFLTGAIGMADGSYSLVGWFEAMGNGVSGMGELIIVTMLAGGLLEIVRNGGGIDYIIERLTSHVHGKRGAELSIGVLVSLVNVCTANNTIAIITVGGIARKIGNRYGVDRRKAASILDTFSCFTQGMLPYGAQVLMAAGLTGLSPIQIIPKLFYPPAIGLCALVAILARRPRRYS